MPKEWLPADDVAHFVAEAVERVPVNAFAVRPVSGGKAQYHPRLMLALLIYSYANGIFSSHCIERAAHRDIGVRYVTANLHPDRDTIAAFHRANRAAFEAAFLQVLLLARESGPLRLGAVPIDDTKLDANASNIRSVRYDPAKQLREKLAADIANLAACAEAADAEGPPDPQALPTEIARREALRAKLDAHEYRKLYNAQAVICAEGSKLILATGVATPADAPSFAATILGMEGGIGLPRTVLTDTGFASGKAVAALEARGIEPLAAIGRTQPHRPYDFRPPPQPRTPRLATEP